MVGDSVIHLGRLRTAQGLARSFETGTLAQAGNFNRLTTTGALLKGSQAQDLGAMIEVYQWALAWGNSNLAAELELKIAEMIRDNAQILDQILAQVVQQRVRPKRFRPSREVAVALTMALGGGSSSTIRRKPKMQAAAILPERQWPDLWQEFTTLAEKKTPMDLQQFILHRLNLDHPLLSRYLSTRWRNNAGSEKIIQAVYGEKLKRLIPDSANHGAEVLKNALAHYCEYADVAHKLFHEGIEDIIWKFFEHILTASPDPWLRYYILKVALYLAIRDHQKQYSERLISLGRLALKDKEPLNALIGFQIIEVLDNELSHQLTREDFSQEWPKPKGLHVFGTAVERRAKGLLIDYIERSSHHIQETRVSIHDLKPTSSLADFNPENDYRLPPFQKKYELLKNLTAQYKDPITFFSHFMAERVLVVALPSGEKLVLNGHHSVAALKRGADEGLIPQGWLESIPADIYNYDLYVPQFLARQILMFGAELTWDDVVPKQLLTPPSR